MKGTFKEINNVINNKTLLVDEAEKGEAMTPYMNVYKAKIQCYGSQDKLKLRILVKGYFQNRDPIGYNWYPTCSMKTLKYLLEYSFKNKVILHQLDSIGAYLQATVNNRGFLKLDSRYEDYFI